jgi:hypothetical protein
MENEGEEKVAVVGGSRMNRPVEEIKSQDAYAIIRQVQTAQRLSENKQSEGHGE